MQTIITVSGKRFVHRCFHLQADLCMVCLSCWQGQDICSSSSHAGAPALLEPLALLHCQNQALGLTKKLCMHVYVRMVVCPAQYGSGTGLYRDQSRCADLRQSSLARSCTDLQSPHDGQADAHLHHMRVCIHVCTVSEQVQPSWSKLKFRKVAIECRNLTASTRNSTDRSSTA